MTRGKIIKGIAGFYYVKANETIYECSARGVFRKQDLSLLIGDDVEIEIEHKESLRGEYKTARIQKVLPRRNKMVRPPVANVDQAVIVFSINYPKPNLDLLDRLLILVHEQEIEPLICINKIDIDDKEAYPTIKEIYSKIGYPIISTSAAQGIGIETFKTHLRDKTSFLAGNSGVGKSTLINAVQPSLSLETGGLSEKIKRGKHTTRHVELMPLELGGYVLDTPGFSSVSIDHLEADELKDYFKEFHLYEGTCKFTGCSHIHEPDCSVKSAITQGDIYPERYKSYVAIYNQLKAIRRW